jgi:hypothetical protein
MSGMSGDGYIGGISGKPLPPGIEEFFAERQRQPQDGDLVRLARKVEELDRARTAAEAANGMGVSVGGVHVPVERKVILDAINRQLGEAIDTLGEAARALDRWPRFKAARPE